MRPFDREVRHFLFDNTGIDAVIPRRERDRSDVRQQRRIDEGVLGVCGALEVRQDVADQAQALREAHAGGRQRHGGSGIDHDRPDQVMRDQETIEFLHAPHRLLAAQRQDGTLVNHQFVDGELDFPPRIEGQDQLLGGRSGGIEQKGNLYVADLKGDQILRRDATTGTVSVFTNQATLNDTVHLFSGPESIAFSSGYTDLYVSSTNDYAESRGGGGTLAIDSASGWELNWLDTNNGSDNLTGWLALDLNGTSLFMTRELPLTVHSLTRPRAD